MAKQEVILYSQPGWYFCDIEKAWLSKHSVDFVNKNIQEDMNALKELQELNVFSTPATIINGELVVGFDTQRLGKLLEISE